MKYKEESAYNALTVTCNSVLSIASKVKDSILHNNGASHFAIDYCANQSTTQPATYLAKSAKCTYHQIGIYCYLQAQGHKL